ncbi:MAG: hypothetical protein IT374_06235 [Polyangiaceae bacterium]|nr:hypothetical protein [Polyangiaceae bacterium]
MSTLTTTRTQVVLVAAALVVACGGQIEHDVDTTGPGSAGSGQGASGRGGAGGRGASAPGGAAGSVAGAPASGAAGSGGSGPVCEAFTVSICNGPCPYKCPGTCLDSNIWPEYKPGLGFCAYGPAWTQKGYYCPLCEDGMVCVGGWRCGPREQCELFELNGQFNSCTYSDFTPYDGAAVPDPEVCPSIPDAAVKLCGGACGVCGPDDGCVQRSPTHPVGLCLPLDSYPGKPKRPDSCGTKNTCDQGNGCYIPTAPLAYMKVQTLAGGLCFPFDTCIALANDLPGGGVCLGGTGAVLGGKWPTE